MKVKSIIIICLAVVLLIVPLSSCTTTDNTPKIKVNLKMTAGDEVLYDTVIECEKAEPTVMDVIKAAIDYYEADITISEDGKYLSKVDIYPDTEIDGVLYFWAYTLNGEEPKGSADTIVVTDGATIDYQFNWTKSIGGGEAESGLYDSDSNVFTEDNGENED